MPAEADETLEDLIRLRGLEGVEPDIFSELTGTRRIDATLAALASFPWVPEGGWSLSELAELCGCTEGAIVARVQQACSRLKPQLGDLYRQIFATSPSSSC